MNSALELAIVYTLVGGAALYALWRFVPGLKKLLAPKLASCLRRAGVISEERAAQLTLKLGKAGGCGSCDSCGACAPKDPRAKP
jgi:hypothetical protein